MTWLIGIWCVIAAVAIGWLLFMEHRATRSLDTHVDTALAMANARERHPATRAQRDPDAIGLFSTTCPTCQLSYGFGPAREHICPQGPR